MNADYCVFWFCTVCLAFYLGMATQYAEGPPIILIEPQKPAPRILARGTDCEDTLVWCRAQQRTGKVRPK